VQRSEPPSEQINCDINSTVKHCEQSPVVFATLHLLCTPSIKTWYVTRILYLYILNLFLKLPLKYSIYTPII